MARNTGRGSRTASVRGPYGFRHAKSRGGLLRPSMWARLRRLEKAEVRRVWAEAEQEGRDV